MPTTTWGWSTPTNPLGNAVKRWGQATRPQVTSETLGTNQTASGLGSASASLLNDQGPGQAPMAPRPQTSIQSLMGPYAGSTSSQQPMAGMPNMGPYAAVPGAADSIIGAAKQHLGQMYQWGGSSPTTGFDCSGLTSWAYAQAGIHIPRTANQQWQAATKLGTNMSAWRPGDLVFFNFGRLGAGQADHVGIYLGNGQFIDAPHSGAPVRIDSLSGAYAQHLLGAGRFA